MVTCPKCKAENRPEAAFCSRCGSILFAQPAATKPVDQVEELKLPPANAAKLPEVLVVPIAVQEAEPEPVALTPPSAVRLQKRSEGSVFDDRFRYDCLITQDEHENNYTVTEIMRADAPSVRICSNPDCRTIHCPAGPDPEKFCTQCGQPLEERSLLFLLTETDENRFDYIKPVLELNLVHPNIHPPIGTFQQELSAGMRYYLVTPFSDNLPPQPEITDVLDWGIQLAEGLDYLQSKGIILGDELDASNIGLAENKAVWRNFRSVRILPMLTDREKINNMRILCLAMYSLMTGNPSYKMDPYLPQALNNIYEKALVGEGFTNGVELIEQIKLAKQEGTERLILDYQVGRRSHPGKVRTLNEDSLLSIELSTIIQGTIQPCGLFAIADGMGGHAAGDMASGLVIDTIAHKAATEILSLQKPTFVEYTEWIDKTVQAANLAVYEARQDAGNDMGSTLVLCLLVGTQAYLTHQGDSRIYLVNQGKIKQLTTDHSLVQHMVSIGQISQDQARNHPQRNVIYRSLGDKPVAEVECITQQVFPHDRLLLCSDGLTNLLEDEKVQQIVLEASSPQVACDQLIDLANSAGGDDNISVIVIEVNSV